MLVPVRTMASEVSTAAPNGPQVATQLGVRAPRTSSSAAAANDAHWIASRPAAS